MSALNMTPNRDCYRAGVVPKVSGLGLVGFKVGWVWFLRL